MEVPLTPDQKAFVRQAIASGRLRNETEAFQEAMAMWERRERARDRILLAVDEAEASLARGEGIPITEESMHAMVEEIKLEGRRRLAAEQRITDS